MSAKKTREQVGDAKAPEQLIRDLVQAARIAFIPETLSKGRDKWFYQQLWHFRKAVTHPAAILDQKGVRLSWDRYQSIVLQIIRDSARHAVGEVKFPGGYLHKCAQLHMISHWEDYYNEAKAKADLRTADRQFKQAVDGVRPTPEAQIVDVFAQVNAALSLNKPRRQARPEKETGAETQLGLF